MYLTVHAAAGAAVGQFIPNVWIAFLAGFISHFILDMIPHGDENIQHWKFFNTKLRRTIAAALIDFGVLIAFSVYWLSTNQIAQIPGIMYGAAGAVLPDALWGFHELTGSKLLDWYRKLHNAAHHIIPKKLTIIQGFLVQVPLLAFCTWILLHW